jgi:hypothetical protein
VGARNHAHVMRVGARNLRTSCGLLIFVTADGEGAVSHAGSRLPADMASWSPTARPRSPTSAILEGQAQDRLSRERNGRSATTAASACSSASTRRDCSAWPAPQMARSPSFRPSATRGHRRAAGASPRPLLDPRSSARLIHIGPVRTLEQDPAYGIGPAAVLGWVGHLQPVELALTAGARSPPPAGRKPGGAVHTPDAPRGP